MLLPEELQSVAFLRDLGEPHVNRLAGLARLVEYPADTVLFREGQDASFIYFLLQGEVGLEVEDPADGAVEVYTAGPGELLGWSPVLGRHAMTATARTATRCRLAALGVRQVAELCEEDPPFGVAFLRQVGVTLSERLASTRRCLAVARTLANRSPFAPAPGGRE